MHAHIHRPRSETLELCNNLRDNGLCECNHLDQLTFLLVIIVANESFPQLSQPPQRLSRKRAPAWLNIASGVAPHLSYLLR